MGVRMEIGSAIGILSGTITVVRGAADAIQYLASKVGTFDVEAALERLPADAPAEEIVRLVDALKGVGGDAKLLGGNDGGGSVTTAPGILMRGGKGTVKGGDFVAKGGDGGPHGPGGPVHMGPGSYGGGDGG